MSDLLGGIARVLPSKLGSAAEELIGRYPLRRSALLPLLHLVQAQDGCVGDNGIAECADLLALTRAEVRAVATLYSMYKRAPTPSSRWTAECLDNCEGAPVVTVDYLNYEGVSANQAEELVDRLAAGEVPPRREGCRLRASAPSSTTSRAATPPTSPSAGEAVREAAAGQVRIR